MSHLPIERLAALIDEVPTPAETEHLSLCAPCSREREALRAVQELAAAERTSLSLPITRWETLAPQLQAEGIIRPLASRSLRTLDRWAMRAAAALLFVVVGVAYGRYTATTGSMGLPGVGSVRDSAIRPVADADTTSFRSPDDAAAVLARARQDYQRAAAYLAEHDTVESADVYRARLATLDELASVTRSALYEAPHDPVINEYYRSTLGAREVTLKQLGTTLPAGMKLSRF